MKKTLFSKIRYILFMLLLGMLLYVIYNFGIATLAVIALIVGTLLFSVNKKTTDYVAFSIFTFSLITAITYKIDLFLESESTIEFYEKLESSLRYAILEGIGILLFTMVIIYLSLNFIKNRK